MIASLSDTALRFLKSVFSLFVVVVVWNTIALPGATQPTTQPQTTTRKLIFSVPPEYPELARKMNIQGVARVLLTVTTDGRVVGIKELGGHPVLIAALVQAVKKWKYEPADRESEIEVRFEFTPGH